VLDRPDEASAIAQRARAFVIPRYGIETMLERMEQVFRSALAERDGVKANVP
jgi:hypothetical protein